jgi:hypothetical protein
MRRGGHVPILAGAVGGVVLFDVERIAVLVRKNKSGIIKRDVVFFQIRPCLILVPLKVLVQHHTRSILPFTEVFQGGSKGTRELGTRLHISDTGRVTAVALPVSLPLR